MPSISIKALVLIHWTLVIWAMSMDWTPPSYIWCNITVLAVGLWAIADRQSVDALFMFIVMILISVIVDIVVLSTTFNGKVTASLYRFSTGMCIMNLILKPVTIVLLYQMYRDRGGEYNINFGPNAPSYEQIGDDSGQYRGSTADFKGVLQQHPPRSRQSDYQNFLDKDVEEATPRDPENEPTSSSSILGN